jgi:hypothetical protein
MDELLGRLIADVGIDRATAEKAVIIILNFLAKEGPSEQVQQLLAAFPGAEAHIDPAAGGGGGLFGGMGGIMGVGTQLMSLGLSMGQVQGVTRELIAFGREKAGEDVVGQIVGSIPGLSQFV